MHPNAIADTDAFLAGIKKLEGYQPDWVKTGRGWQFGWSISDGTGSIVGQLRFECDLRLQCISISVIFASHSVTRLDVVPDHHWHENRYGAGALGLEPKIYGTHIHSWPDNRLWLSRNNTPELVFCRAVEYPTEDFSATFSMFADEINLTLEPGQRSVFLPRQGDLFAGGGRS